MVFLDRSAYFPHCVALNAKGCFFVLISDQVAHTGHAYIKTDFSTV